jgi:hypothetical protein
MLSEDDLDIADLSPQELDAAWDLWFDLAQATDEDDPPYTHGVLAGLRRDDLPRASSVSPPAGEQS